MFLPAVSPCVVLVSGWPVQWQPWCLERGSAAARWTYCSVLPDTHTAAERCDLQTHEHYYQSGNQFNRKTRVLDIRIPIITVWLFPLARLSYLYNGNSYTGKTASLNLSGPKEPNSHLIWSIKFPLWSKYQSFLLNRNHHPDKASKNYMYYFWGNMTFSVL